MLVAMLEDDTRRQERMSSLLTAALPAATVIVFDNAPDMIDWLSEHLAKVSLLCLDHDLGPNRERNGEVFDPGSGRNVVDFLVAYSNVRPVIVHTSNGIAASGMLIALEGAGWPVSRVVPFQYLAWVEVSWLPTVLRMLRS